MKRKTKTWYKNVKTKKGCTVHGGFWICTSIPVETIVFVNVNILYIKLALQIHRFVCIFAFVLCILVTGDILVVWPGTQGSTFDAIHLFFMKSGKIAKVILIFNTLLNLASCIITHSKTPILLQLIF